MNDGRDIPRIAGAIDASAPVPMHEQLKRLLIDQIDSNRWQPGDRLPSEQELQDAFAISRTPIRQALQALANEGYLVRRKGKGTYVRKPQIVQPLPRLTGFTEDMRSKGLTPGFRLLEVSLEVAPPSRFAGVTVPDRPVPTVRRLMLANGEPMAVHTSYLLAEALEPLLPKLRRQLGQQDSLYAFLRTHLGIDLAEARQWIGATNASDAVAAQLGVEPGAALVTMDRFVNDVFGKPIEYVRAAYRGDLYHYYVELSR